MTWTPERLAAKRAEYMRRKLAGECVECAAGLQDDDGLRCVECAEVARTSLSKTRTARYWRRRAEGKCVDCESPRLSHVLRCELHNAHHNARQAAYVRRNGGAQPKGSPSVSNVAYEPAPAELTKQDAMLRALSHWDWVTMTDLFFAMDVEEDYKSEARNAAAQMLGRLVKMGQAESTGKHGERLYRITPAGRALIADKLRRVA